MIADFGDKRFTEFCHKNIIDLDHKKKSDIGHKKITNTKLAKNVPTAFNDKNTLDFDGKRITELVGEVFGDHPVKRITKMGNVCIFNQNNNVHKISSSPHSLEELLSGIANPEGISSENVNSVIDSNPWTSRFKDFLAKRNLEDDLNILKFLVMVQAIRTKNINKKNPKDLHSFKSKKVLDICETFFSEDSESQLPLSNQVLWTQLFAMTNSLKAGLAVSEEALDDVIAARKDPAVWDEGLEPIFIKFVQQSQAPTLACLLSIL